MSTYSGLHSSGAGRALIGYDWLTLHDPGLMFGATGLQSSALVHGGWD